MIPGIGGLVGKTKKLPVSSPTIESRAHNYIQNTTQVYAIIPSGIVAGNLLLMHVIRSSGGGSVSINTPSGWTQLYHLSWSSTSSQLTAYGVYYKFASGSEVNFFVTGGGASSEWIVDITRISGQSYQQPPVTLGTSTGNGSSLDPPAVSPSWGDEYGSLCIVGTGHKYRNISVDNETLYVSSPITGPSGYVTTYNNSSATTQFHLYNPNHHHSLLTIWKKNFTSTTENPSTITAPTMNWYATTTVIMGT